MFDPESSADFVVGVGVHSEVEGWTVALGTVIVVGGQDLDDLMKKIKIKSPFPNIVYCHYWAQFSSWKIK